MKESRRIIILIIIFALGGLFIFFFASHSSKFNFYLSEMSSQGNVISEKIYFKPDKSYHTLFKSFVTPIASSQTPDSASYIKVSNVKCSSGTPYVRNYEGECAYFD